MALSYNQIAGFFDHQYFRNELIDILEIIINGRLHVRQTFWIGFSHLSLFPNQIEGSLERIN